MNFAGGLRCLGPGGKSPGARFLRTGSEEGLQAEQLVASADDAAQSRFFQPQFGQEFGPVFGRHRDQFGFDGRGNHHGLGAFCLGLGENQFGQRIAAGGVFFGDVADIEHRLGGQQLRLLEDAGFFLVLGFGQSCRLAVLEQLERLAKHAGHQLGFLVAAGGALGSGGDTLLEAFKVGQ